MTDRHAQIKLLIATRFDLLWFPSAALRTQPGLAPGKRVPCPDCGGVRLQDDFGKTIRRRKGRGFVVDRFKRRMPCTTCGGRIDDGELVPGSGWIDRDPMVPREVVGSTGTQASARPRKTVRCDACNGEGATTHGRCARCNGTGRRDLHVFDLTIDAGERTGADPIDVAIDRRDQEGDWHALEKAMSGFYTHLNKQLLTVLARDALRLLDDLYLPPPSRSETDLLPSERLLVDLALRYIDTRMPADIRVPAWAAQAVKRRTPAKGQALNEHQRRVRDERIRRWASSGEDYDVIRERTGLSDRQLREIINRKEHAA